MSTFRASSASRSQLYSDALAQYLSARGAAEVTAGLNRVYAANPSEIEPALLRAQVQNLTDDAW
ncbi:MAG TPA: hypothetical protein VFX69_07045 [Steroidobacteraceae bacterium]|nr:hypothetical protein [Steroidobacteraceae bacterium]